MLRSSAASVTTKIRVAKVRAGPPRSPRGFRRAASPAGRTRRSGLRPLRSRRRCRPSRVGRRPRARALPVSVAVSISSSPSVSAGSSATSMATAPTAQSLPSRRRATARYGVGELTPIASRGALGSVLASRAIDDQAPAGRADEDGSRRPRPRTPLRDTTSHSRVRGIPEMPASTQRNVRGSLRLVAQVSWGSMSP